MYVDDAGFGRVRAVRRFVCRVAKAERLMLEIWMWFGSTNKETYVYVCDRARGTFTKYRKRSGDRDDPTGLELSPVGRSSGLGLSVCVTCERNVPHPPSMGWVGLFYRRKRPTRTW